MTNQTHGKQEHHRHGEQDETVQKNLANHTILFDVAGSSWIDCAAHRDDVADDG
jgi:hypothetical protein